MVFLVSDCWRAARHSTSANTGDQVGSLPHSFVHRQCRATDAVWIQRQTAAFSIGAADNGSQCYSQVGKRAGCKRNRAQSSARTTKIRAQFSARTTHNRAQFRARMTKIRSQSSTRTKRGLGTILWAIDENMGTNLLAFYKHSYTPVRKHKNSNYIL